MDYSTPEDFAKRFPEALESGLIRACFQPVFRSLTQQIFGVEALARWYQPDGSMISPDRFIPVLEQNGLIFRLDMEILRQSCVLYDEFRRRGTPLQCVSVNLSRLDFKQDQLFETVCDMLQRHSVPHDAIKLEITESMMLEDTESFERTFRLFADAGFKVWLDDFGSGYSSLNVLQNYSFDVIKFDMLFLRKLSVRGREMLASLISMAKTLGIHTLTEGVETDEQRKFLLSAGCEAMQGYYYAKPMPREKLTELIDQKTGILEGPEDFTYWNEIGRLNLVNPNPLKDYAERRASLSAKGFYVSSFDGSIALVECGQDHFNYVYATEGYQERLRELGFSTVGSIEHALSDGRNYQYVMMQKLVIEALRTGTIQTAEYVYRGVYYRLSALFIARREGKAMIAMRLNTFDSEREVETAKEMLNIGSALLTTYDLVVKILPGQKASKRIYTANTLAEYDREPTFASSLQKFCRDHVEPVDQERYLQFMNLDTMTERIQQSSRHFIQSVFRMRLEKGRSNWYSARITQIPATTETEYLLTVQIIPPHLSKWIDQFMEENRNQSQQA